MHMQKLLQAVQRWPEVIACYALTGDMDYMLHVYCEDLDHFSRFVMGELLTHPGVEDLRSSFVLTDVKRTTALPLAPVGRAALSGLARPRPPDSGRTPGRQ